MSYYADLAGKIERVLCHAASGAGQGLRHGHQHADGRVRAIVPYNFPLTLMGTKIGPTISAMVDATFEGLESNRRFYLVFFDFLGYAVRNDRFGDVGATFHEICNGLTPRS